MPFFFLSLFFVAVLTFLSRARRCPCFDRNAMTSRVTSGDGQPEDGDADAGGGMREALRRGAAGLLENLLHVSRRGRRVRADRQGEEPSLHYSQSNPDSKRRQRGVCFKGSVRCLRPSRSVVRSQATRARAVSSCLCQITCSHVVSHVVWADMIFG